MKRVHLGLRCIGFGIGCLLVMPTYAASFDCEKTQTHVEYWICDRPWISELDDAVSAAYKAVMQGSKRPSAIRLAQKQWLKGRDACDDASCIGRMYEGRLTELMRQAALLNPSTSAYYMYLGWGKPLCAQVLKRLNEEIARKPKGPVCGFDILQSVPGVELPAWKQLDLHEHKALYKRYALTYLIESKDWLQAFSDPPPKAGERMASDLRPSVMPSDEQLEQSWRDAIARKAQFYRLDNPVPRQEDGDVLLLSIGTPTGENCLSVRTRLFAGDLRAPKFNWPTYSGYLPFTQEGQTYQMSWSLGSRIGDDPMHQITHQVDIESDSTEMCRLFRNPPFFK